MNKKYWRALMIMEFFCFMIFIMSGCSIREIDAPVITEFEASVFLQTDYFVIDNETPLNELLTREYELDALEMFFGKYSAQGAGMLKDMGEAKYHTWDEVNLQFPVQCVRYHYNVHYSVYKVKEGGYYYVFWMVPVVASSYMDEMEQEERIIEVFSSIYIDKLASVSSFESVVKRFSTAKDVLKIDSHMELDFLSSSVTSYSLLDDGRVIIVKYFYDKLESIEDLVVKDIMICSKNAVPSKLSAISTEDLP